MRRQPDKLKQALGKKESLTSTAHFHAILYKNYFHPSHFISFSTLSFHFPPDKAAKEYRRWKFLWSMRDVSCRGAPSCSSAIIIKMTQVTKKTPSAFNYASHKELCRHRYQWKMKTRKIIPLIIQMQPCESMYFVKKRVSISRMRTHVSSSAHPKAVKSGGAIFLLSLEWCFIWWRSIARGLSYGAPTGSLDDWFYTIAVSNVAELFENVVEMSILLVLISLRCFMPHFIEIGHCIFLWINNQDSQVYRLLKININCHFCSC